MALGAYNKQYKQRCHKCEKYRHEPRDCKCPLNKKESNDKMKTGKKTTKTKKIMECAIIAVERA